MKSQAMRLLFVLSIAINLGGVSAIGWHHFGRGAPESAAGGGAPPDTPSLGDELELTAEPSREVDRPDADLDELARARGEPAVDEPRQPVDDGLPPHGTLL